MKKITVLGAFLFSLSLPVFGMQRPSPEQVAAYRQDGSFDKRLAFARRVGNNRFAPGAVERLKNNLQIRSLMQRGLSREKAAVMAPPPRWRGLPTTGTPKMFTLLIEFNDYLHNNSSDTIHAQLFGAGAGGYPYESLTNYYSRSSYGLLTIQGDTLGWFNPGTPRASVVMDDTGRETLIKQAIASFVAAGHDFAQYDNNGDGAVDYFAVIWTGPDNGWAQFWWGYQTTFGDPAYTVSGKKLGSYSWQWEANPFPGAYDPLVIIHETGHALGLPDYYDYLPGMGPEGGVGGLDMMDANLGDHNAFSKFILDWLSPVNSASGNLAGVLRPTDAFPDAVKMMPASAPGDIFNEFFVVQNRRQTANDQDMPASGLLIWHVDAHLTADGKDYLYDNSYTPHKFLRLMEADGLESIEAGFAADAGDYYGPGNALTPVTVPNSNSYAGEYTGINIRNIAGTPASRTFDSFVMNANKLVAPTDNLFRPLKGGKCKLDVTALKAGAVTIKVYTVNGAFVKTIYNGPTVAGVTTYTWAGDTEGGPLAASGLYLVHVSAPGVDTVEKVVLIK